MPHHAEMSSQPAGFADEQMQYPVDTGERRRMVCSFPKTGRTWLRFMLASALFEHYNLGADIDLTNVYEVVPNGEASRMSTRPAFAYEGQIPKVEMSHRPYTAQQHSKSELIFLTRDPRDVMVSRWLHNKNQLHRFAGNLTEFVHDEDLGIGSFLSHLESWTPHISEEQIITYEAMRLDPVAALKKAINRLKLPITGVEIEHAVAAGAMDRMREKEIERGIAGHMYDRSNPEALRVRRGKVGGFTDYMSAEDQHYIEQEIANSNPDAQKVLALTGYRPK